MKTPSSRQVLEAVLRLASEIHLEMTEQQIVERFLDTLRALFPKRAIAIRTVDLHSRDPARVCGTGAELRFGVEDERVTLKQTAVDKTKLKPAVLSSARVRVSDRWDSPFGGLAIGFSVPLVASGELYGVVDVGYPLGADNSAEDEGLVLPFANHLSVALRNERLHRETMVLRDYNATLIEHANALILGVDRQWRITVCNQALSKLTGFPRDEVLGSDLRDFLPVEDRPRLSRLILEALAGRRTDAVEVELEKHGGGRVRTMWSVAAISRQGQVEAVVAVGQDLTRVRELQSQVIQAEKLATLGQLAAGVVHELNNPLTSITVYADFLLKKAERAPDEPLSHGDIDKLARISAGANRILQFARDLVQYAKPTGSELRDISVSDVVEQSMSFCEHLFARGGVSKQVDVVANLPPVLAVAGQLEQVVINLVTNAVHAVGEGGCVHVTTFGAGSGRVGVRVEDDGPGIAPTDRARIFEPFFTTKTDGAGTGLGLSIVKNIVDQHGGCIEVGTSPHGGASFTILLPVDPRSATLSS